MRASAAMSVVGTIVFPARGNNRGPVPLQFRGVMSDAGCAALSFTDEGEDWREHSHHRDRDW